MTGWYAGQAPDKAGRPGEPGRLARGTIAVTLLALLVITAVPAALVAAVVMMLLGHVIGGLAVFGGTVLAAVAVLTLVGMAGVRRVRKLLSGEGFQVVRLDATQYGDVPPYGDGPEPAGREHPSLVQLDRSDYTDVR